MIDADIHVGWVKNGNAKITVGRWIVQIYYLFNAFIQTEITFVNGNYISVSFNVTSCLLFKCAGVRVPSIVITLVPSLICSCKI